MSSFLKDSISFFGGQKGQTSPRNRLVRGEGLEQCSGHPEAENLEGTAEDSFPGGVHGRMKSFSGLESR